MSDEKKNETLTDRKKEVIQSIQRAAEIYTIASVCTKMPYVFCDPETFDDEVFVFLKLEDAQTAAKALAEEKEPVSLVKVENKHLLHFFFQSLHNWSQLCCCGSEFRQGRAPSASGDCT